MLRRQKKPPAKWREAEKAQGNGDSRKEPAPREMSSDFRLCKLIDRGIFPAIGADILLRGSIAVDIAVSHRGYCAELHRYCHADILGDGKEARAVLHTAAYLAARSNHRIPAAFGGGNASLGEGRNSHRDANRRRLIAYSGTSLRFVEHFRI